MFINLIVSCYTFWHIILNYLNKIKAALVSISNLSVNKMDYYYFLIDQFRLTTYYIILLIVEAPTQLQIPALQLVAYLTSLVPNQLMFRWRIFY